MRTGAGSRTAHGIQPCPGCRAPTLTQTVGRTAALTITADLTPLTPEQQAHIRGPNQLIWCLRQASPHTPPRLAWIHNTHPPDCPHPHVTDHRCPPSTLF